MRGEIFMGLSLSTTNASLRNQTGVFTGCCNQILDNLGSICTEDEPVRFYLVSRLSIPSSELFSAEEVFTSGLQRTQDGRFSQINEVLEEVIEEEDLKGVLALLQNDFKEKIGALSFDENEEIGALRFRSNLDSLKKNAL